MSKTHQDLSETHILGEETTQKVVRVDGRDRREWLAKAPACSALAQHRIAHLGICEAQAPYNIVRMKQSGTYFMACYGGEGRILVDGRWQRCRAGMACLLPPHLLNAFHAVPSKPWNFVWVRYQAVPEQRLWFQPVHRCWPSLTPSPCVWPCWVCMRSVSVHWQILLETKCLPPPHPLPRLWPCTTGGTGADLRAEVRPTLADG